MWVSRQHKKKARNEYWDATLCSVVLNKHSFEKFMKQLAGRWERRRRRKLRLIERFDRFSKRDAGRRYVISPVLDKGKDTEGEIDSSILEPRLQMQKSKHFLLLKMNSRVSAGEWHQFVSVTNTNLLCTS